MIEIIMIIGLFYGAVVNEYPGPKTQTSQELYQQKKAEGNYMNVLETNDWGW